MRFMNVVKEDVRVVGVIMEDIGDKRLTMASQKYHKSPGKLAILGQYKIV